MIIVKLLGGLGNQMFQYALGRHLAVLNKTKIKFDITSFKNDPQREYALNCFNIQENFATDAEIRRFKKYKRKNGKIWFLYNRLIANKTKYFQERQFHCDAEVLKLKDEVYLDGYWNTEKYFIDIRDILLEDFRTKKPLCGKNEEVREIITSTNSVSVHIRRGDYANDPRTNIVHGTLGKEYYEKAIKIINLKIENTHFFIFSDDMDWVRKNIPFPSRTTYIDWNKADKNYEDLRLMTNCKHHIIANSTFSWWGAWLSENPEKIVIAPTKWFNTKKAATNTKDVIPNSWITI